MLSIAASLAALAWFGMWMGMTSRNAGMATLKTILFVKVIPTLAIYFVTLFATALLVMPLTLLMTGASTAPVTTTTTNSAGRIVVTASSSANLAMLSFGLVWTCVPAVLTIVASIGLAALARSRLLARFRQLAAGSLAPARVDIAYRAPPPVRAPPVIGAPAQ
jgi:hypothetical protein